MPKTFAAAIAAGVLLAILAMSCAPAQKAAQPLTPPTGTQVAANKVGTAASPDDARGGSGAASDGLFADAQSPIGIDYSPEGRCAENPDWLPGLSPRSCNPQLSRDERTCGNRRATCPNLCLKCYSDDLQFIKRDLRVNTITVYYPNYYVLKAAQRLGMKVILGLLNNSVLGLATPASQADCTYGRSPLSLCGSNYADALFDGVCIDKVGGDPFKPCIGRCLRHSDPPRDCANGDCSCRSDSDCPGSSNRCLTGLYLAPLNNPASGEFLRDGTVIGIQLGNEFLGACDIVQVPGQEQSCCGQDQKTGRCNAWIVNRQVISMAAKTLRAALNRHGAGKVKISVGLVEKQGRKFCQNGMPPPGVDLIASHPYCDFVAEMPPLWSTLNGAQCWEQARYEKFPVDQKACGAANTYIGETGYNSGCPLFGQQAALLKAEKDFVNAMVADEPSCKGQPNPTAPFPNFLFEFSDVCPPGGCLAGCGDPVRCNPKCCCNHQCSGHAMCGPQCPSCFGNGYFGLYHTPGYGTAGFPPEPKFDPTPSLLCPARN